jgi:hypothetical protein
MQKWHELDVVMDLKYNKPAYQPCTVFPLALNGQPREGQRYCFQPVTIEGPNGPVTLSWTYPKGTSPNIPLNQEVECRVKVEADNSQYAINGKKYTLIEKLAENSGGGGSRKSYGKSPEERASIEHQKAFDLSKDIYQIAFEIAKYNAGGGAVLAANIRPIVNDVMINIKDNASEIVKWISQTE